MSKNLDYLCPLRYLSCYLKLSGRSGRNRLISPPVLSSCNGSPDTRFSRGTTRLMSWHDGERYLGPLQSLIVSLLLSLVSTRLFSNWRRNVSSKLFDTHVPSISTEKLVLPRHVRGVLYRLRCNGHCLHLSSYLSRIGRIESPSCSASGYSSQDASRLILHCLATVSLRSSLFGNSLSLRPLVQALGSCSASGAPWSSTMPPSLGRGRVTTATRIKMRQYASSPRKKKSGYER